MKLPRVGEGQVQSMGRFEAALLPAPRMVTRRNMRYIPQRNPEGEMALKAGRIQLFTDIAKNAGTMVNAVIKANADSEFAAAKADYLAKTSEYKYKLETSPFSVTDADGNVTYPWQEANNDYSQYAQDEAARITQDMGAMARKEFAAWRAEVDSKNSESLREYRRDREVDKMDAEWTEGEDAAVRNGNLNELNRIHSERVASGMFNQADLVKTYNANVDRMFTWDVQKRLNTLEQAAIGMTTEEIDAAQADIINSLVNVPPEKRDALYDKAMDLDDIRDEELEERQDNAWGPIQTDILGQDTKAASLNRANAYLDMPNIERVIGDDNYATLYKLRDSMYSEAEKSNKAALAQATAAVEHYRTTGDGYEETLALLNAQLGTDINASSWSELTVTMSKAKESRVGDAVKAATQALHKFLNVTPMANGLVSGGNPYDQPKQGTKQKLDPDQTQRYVTVLREMQLELQYLADNGQLSELTRNPAGFAEYVRRKYNRIVQQDPEAPGSTVWSMTSDERVKAGDYSSMLQQFKEHRARFERFMQAGNTASDWRDSRGTVYMDNGQGGYMYPNEAGITRLQGMINGQ